jgi:hypothetical protein
MPAAFGDLTFFNPGLKLESETEVFRIDLR